MPERLHRALSEISALLDARGNPYMAVGAIAVAIWGRPRATVDIDVTVLTDPAGLEALAQAATAAAFAVDEEWQTANPLLHGQHLRLIRHDIVIDLMRPRNDHEHHALGRSRRVAMAGKSVPVVAPDDLILMKLKVGRPRDFDDALGVLEMRRAEMDETYLFDWAQRLGITDELAWLMDAEADE